MATNVQVETVIDRPRNPVADYAMDWRNDTSWIRAISEARLVTDGPFGVGSRVERVASFLGRRIEYVNEVVELEPGARLVMRSVKAPFPMKVTYEFEEAGGRTRMRIRVEGDAGGFYKLAGPVLSRAVRKGIEGDLAQLKAILEK
jgi:Polyketide cyclase / dehydrase and lipid transport